MGDFSEGWVAVKVQVLVMLVQVLVIVVQVLVRVVILSFFQLPVIAQLRFLFLELRLSASQ